MGLPRLLEPRWEDLDVPEAQVRSLGTGAWRAKAYYLLGHQLARHALAAGRPTTSAAAIRPTTSDAAMYALATAHALHPQAAAYTELGVLLKARGRIAEARDMLALALRFTPAEPAAYRHLAQLQPTSSLAVSLLRAAASLSPADGSAHFALASSLRAEGNLAAAQSAIATAIALSPGAAEAVALFGDFRGWERAYHARRRELRGGIGYQEARGIGYQESLQFPFSGRELRALADSQAALASARLALPRKAPREIPVRLGHGGLCLCYTGALTDEPQLRAMASLFSQLRRAVGGIAFFPLTLPPSSRPDYWRRFELALSNGTMRNGPAGSAAALAHEMGPSGHGCQVVLDGAWRKECTPEGTPGGKNDSLSRLYCALLDRPAPLQFALLAAPLTAGGSHLDYTLADRVALPPRLAPAFAEHLTLLPAGGYPFSHASWASPPMAAETPRRSSEGLPRHAIVLGSFVQRWKVNPRMWQPWLNLLRRTPRAVLWVLQHSLDAHTAPRALSSLLSAEMRDVHRSRLHVMGRRPLEQHVQRTGLVDLVLDTHPYTAHTTAADALWQNGPPWLALGSGDRFDSLLSSSALHHAGWLELRQLSLRAFEDCASALVGGQR